MSSTAALPRAEVASSVDQLKQLARFTETDRAWIELLSVIEQILVAGDDRLGTGFPGQRKEIVVLGISKGRLDIGGIIERNRDHRYPLHGFSRFLGTRPVAEVGLA